MSLTYYRDLKAYGDGRYLYVSAAGMNKSWPVGPSTVRYFERRHKPDIVVDHWGGVASGPLKLYRRERGRRWWGSPRELRHG